MIFRGGMNFQIKGRPDKTISELPLPEALHLPRITRRLNFQELRVKDGAVVNAGDVVACDPKSFDVPLLAPCKGVLSLSPSHITIANLEEGTPALGNVPPDRVAKRKFLLEKGVWPFLSDGWNGRIPNPDHEPSAIIVSTMNLEPFSVRGDVQLLTRFDELTAALKLLQGLLEYQPIFLVIPSVKSPLADKLRTTLRGLAFVSLVEVPRRYGLDKFPIIARALKLRNVFEQPVWAMHTEGLLAIGRVLATGAPMLSQLISIGGPAVLKPRHLQLSSGYPIQKLIADHVNPESLSHVCTIGGGLFTGTELSGDCLGLDIETHGLTLLDSRPTVSVSRACIACGECEKICPAGIMPQMVHRYFYQDAVEDAEKVGAELCTGCGLCSFVCPSKIELRKEILSGQKRIQEELYGK